jgi:hypothetical protein
MDSFEQSFEQCGVIVRYRDLCAVATGPSQEYVEQIALELFRRQGYELEGVEVDIIVFDPSRPGGILFEANEDIPSDMTGWSEEGFEA